MSGHCVTLTDQSSSVTDRHSLPDVVEVENTQQFVDFLLLHHFNRYCVDRSRL